MTDENCNRLGSNKVSAYAINTETGILTHIDGSPFDVGLYPQSVTVDLSGKFAYVTNKISDNVSVYAINTETGVLTEIDGSPFAAGDGPPSIVIVKMK